jgi:hypothetical protein
MSFCIALVSPIIGQFTLAGAFGDVSAFGAVSVSAKAVAGKASIAETTQTFIRAFSVVLLGFLIWDPPCSAFVRLLSGMVVLDQIPLTGSENLDAGQTSANGPRPSCAEAIQKGARKSKTFAG